MPIFTKDSFDGTASTDVSTRSPTGAGATGAWSGLGDGRVILNGSGAVTYNVGSTDLYPYLASDNGSPDHYVEVEAGAGTGGNFYLVMVRYQDAGNFVAIRNAGGGLQAMDLSGGSQGAPTQSAVSVAAGDIIRVECSGTSVVVKKNGVTALTHPTARTGTRCGMGPRSAVTSDVIRAWESGTDTPPPAPDAPTSVTVPGATVAARQATVNFTPGSGATSHRLETAPSPDFNVWTSRATGLGASATTGDATGLPPNTELRARVVAVNANGETPSAPSSTFKTRSLQSLRPSSDVSLGPWTPSTGSSGAAVIGENPSSDLDFISATAAGAAVFQVASGSDPGMDIDHDFRVRGRGDGVTAITFEWFQGNPGSGGSLIISGTITPGASVAAQTFPLSTVQAALITNYAQLFLRITRA